MQHYTVYGITMASGFPFTWPLARADAPADLRFACVDAPPLQVDWSERAPRHRIPTGKEGPADIAFFRVGGGTDTAGDRTSTPIDPGEEIDVIRFRRTADHYLFPDRIVCHLHDPDLAYLVEIQLLGVVLALWLERRGVPVLHASCGVIEGRAVAFLGAKGSGKTTLAAGLLAAGHALLTDDLLAIEGDRNEVLAHSGTPMLRLDPEQAEAFVGSAAGFAPVHPSFSKRVVPIGADFGRFHARSAPLGRIFLPRRTRNSAVSIGPVAPGHALLALVGQSYLEEELHALELAGPRLRRLGEMLRGRVQVCSLEYPDGFEQVGAVVAAVEAHLREAEALDRGS